jgi:hypothetical protein
MPQSDGCEPQGQAQSILSRLGACLEAFIAIQPAEMFDVFRAFRCEGGIERDFFAAYAAGGGSRIIYSWGTLLTDKGGEFRPSAYQEAFPHRTHTANADGRRFALTHHLNPSRAQANHLARWSVAVRGESGTLAGRLHLFGHTSVLQTGTAFAFDQSKRAPSAKLPC